MKNKHTPGYWAVDGFQAHDHCITVIADSRTVACVCTVDAAKETAEEKANARLIAAAPELLQTCQFVLAAIDPSSRLLAQPRCVALLRAVIAKATGGKGGTNAN